MAQISIADDLLRRVDDVRPASVSAEQFVADAVREKLSWQENRAEFFQLSDETRQMMEAKGITQAEILADFEASREGLARD